LIAETTVSLHCEFSQVDNIYAVTISNPFDFIFVINEDSELQSYIEAAKYILDKGRIISIIPNFEKHPHNFFLIYIKIENINRHYPDSKKKYY
jgi:hypothetical protein